MNAVPYSAALGTYEIDIPNRTKYAMNITYFTSFFLFSRYIPYITGYVFKTWCHDTPSSIIYKNSRLFMFVWLNY